MKFINLGHAKPYEPLERRALLEPLSITGDPFISIPIPVHLLGEHTLDLFAQVRERRP
jgi:hypothetical protein